MKKLLSTTIALLMIFSVFSVPVLAEEADSATVYLTLSDDDGKLVLSQEAITVTDIDQDGALTINDALYAAHELSYEGGAAAGYASSIGQYGLSLDKLWGVANGGGYGYAVNNVSAMGLADPIKDGDFINAYVYTDLVGWSDTYCYFDNHTLTVKAGESVTLTLSSAGYDESWNPITLPVEGAELTVNGVNTGIKTDSEGKATITLDDSGSFIISALSSTQTLVPPVCKVKVTATAVGTPENGNPNIPATGDRVYVGALLLVLSLVGAAVITKKRVYEK